MGRNSQLFVKPKKRYHFQNSYKFYHHMLLRTEKTEFKRHVHGEINIHSTHDKPSLVPFLLCFLQTQVSYITKFNNFFLYDSVKNKQALELVKQYLNKIMTSLSFFPSQKFENFLWLPSHQLIIEVSAFF